MALIQVTSREFRDNQASLFDLADKGDQVVIRRGKKQTYILTLLKEDDITFTLSPEAIERIEAGRKQYANGQAKTFGSAADAIDFLESL